MDLFSKNLSDKLDTSSHAGNTENSVPDHIEVDTLPQESRAGEQQFCYNKEWFRKQNRIELIESHKSAKETH